MDSKTSLLLLYEVIWKLAGLWELYWYEDERQGHLEDEMMHSDSAVKIDFDFSMMMNVPGHGPSCRRKSEKIRINCDTT